MCVREREKFSLESCGQKICLFLPSLPPSFLSCQFKLTSICQVKGEDFLFFVLFLSLISATDNAINSHDDVVISFSLLSHAGVVKL